VPAVSEPVQITRQEMADFKVLFPPEVVDRALAKRSLVLMDEHKVSNNVNSNSKNR
jgi:hypothetical protein